MAAITVTAAQVAVLFTISGKAKIYDGIAGATITAGQALYIDASGDLQLADATIGGAIVLQVVGIALNGGGAGAAISYLQHGYMYGCTLAGAYWAPVYLSETPGGLDTAVTGGTVPIGRVVPLPDASRTKVLFVDVDPTSANYT